MKIAIDKLEITEETNPDESRIHDLADSMKEHGLSHPIIVRAPNNSNLYPVASGRTRLLAAKHLGWTEIECEIRDISESKGKEIRLHENLKRKNLEWHEQVFLVEELHSLRQSEHGIATKGRPHKDEEKQGWSIRDTAAELGVGIGPLSEDLGLARAIRNNPTLLQVKDKKTAIRLVKIAAKRHSAEQEASLPTTFDANQVFCGDSSSVLSNLPENSIDHCITDPPWIKFFDASLTLDERTLPVFKALYRVLKHGAFLFVFCGLDDYAYYAGVTLPDPNNPAENTRIPGALEKIGFTVSNTPIIWVKEKSLSRRGVRPWEYSRDMEFIIVAVKGSATLVSTSQLSAIKSFPIVHPSKMIHPNEKPIELIKDIITDMSYEGNIIVDPFGGSGVLAEACKATGRKYVICERDKKFYDNICKRLEGEK